MLIVSQNATNYDIDFPDDAILRINLAWCNSLEELEINLKKHVMHRIFIDLPVGRIKPPNNKYSLKEIIPILRSHKNICYFAISNVEDENDLREFLDLIPNNITIVPKIESPRGVKNIKKIIKKLDYDEKYLMLDHDDLFSNIKKNQEDPLSFQRYIKELIRVCHENDVHLLRTVGVIFSEDEKRETQYIK
jgi:pyruvate kinase